MFQNLNKSQQIGLASGLLGMVIAVFCVLVAVPVVQKSRLYSETIEELEFRLQRFKKIAAGKDLWLSRAEAIKRRQGETNHFITRETSALASADLQQLVKTIIASAGGELTSTQVVPQKNEENFVRITIKVRMTGNMDVLRHVLYDIETAKPLLILENINLRPIRGRRNRKTRKIEASDKLNINFDVVGYMRAMKA